jgi:hypothetical protein
LVEAYVLAVGYKDFANESPVAISLILAFKVNRLSRNYFGETLSRFRSEGLAMLRRVDAREAKGGGKTARTEHVDSIAVGDANDFRGEVVRRRDYDHRPVSSGRAAPAQPDIECTAEHEQHS